MSLLSRKQGQIIRRQIRRDYQRNFIPVISQEINIGLGDILDRRVNGEVYLDGDQFPKELLVSSSRNRLSKTIKTASETNISTMAEGKTLIGGVVPVGKIGVKFTFSGANEAVMVFRNMSHFRLDRLVDIRDYVIDRFTTKDISSKVFVVSGILSAEQLFVQFSGSKGGEFGLSLDVDPGEFEGDNTQIDTASVLATYRKNVGFDLSAPNGGVLGYRVNRIRLNDTVVESKFIDALREQYDEEQLLEKISVADRKALASDGGFSFSDDTDGFIIEQDEMLNS